MDTFDVCELASRVFSVLQVAQVAQAIDKLRLYSNVSPEWAVSKFANGFPHGMAYCQEDGSGLKGLTFQPDTSWTAIGGSP